jgi:drug/metabolite transporter (DMT)-like permease
VSHSRRQLLAEIMLFGVAVIWGWTFALVKDAVGLYPTMPFLALRFTLATLVFGAVVLLRRRPWRRRAVDAPAAGTSPQAGESGARDAAGPASGERRGSVRSLLAGGGIMGVFLAGGYIFQTLGLERTTASNAGFITGLFVAIVPVMQMVVWKRWVGARAIIGVVLAVGGLFLLSGAGSGSLHLAGDSLVFLCAVSFSAHIIATSRFASRHDTMWLTLVQLSAVAVITSVLSVGGAVLGLAQPLWFPREAPVWEALAVTAALATALGFFVQTQAQRYASPTRTAIILTAEPVFSGVFGYLLLQERLTVLGWGGAGLILVGMLVSELSGGGAPSAPGGQDGVKRVMAEEMVELGG